MTAEAARWPYLAGRHEITVWADRADAPHTLPRLIRRLIDQTNDQVVELKVRTDEGVRLRGYDGFSRALRGTPFVPEGPAVWEMSTDQDVEQKANEDYAKRTEKPLGIGRVETTFVVVTPRSWPGKDEWAKEKRAEGVWADVIAHDVDDIDQAFERAPAAHVWFSELVGLPAQGAQSLTQWWEKFSQLSSPPLTPALVLAGRADEAAALLRLLDGPAQISAVFAHNEEELLTFVAAVVLSVPDDDRVRVLSTRCIVVKDSYTLNRLEYTPDALILVPYYDELRREARLVRGHHVLIRADDGGSAAVNVPPIDIVAFKSVLMEDGLDEQEALVLARLARRSIYAFQRATPMAQVMAPGWVSSLQSPVIRRGWLAGRWDERRSGDIQALEALFGVPYAEAREEITRLAGGADPLFVRVGGSWTLTSLEDAWRFGHSHLEPSDLAAYEELIQSVLGAVDPRLELPVADRWMAAVYGKTPVHSSDLRHGMAEVLGIIGAKGEAISIGSNRVQSWLYSVLHRLFDRLNDDLTGHLWASLTDVLPLLAEAGPDVFLSAVSDGLVGEQPLLQMMFADHDGSDALTISSPHPGLLWALEALAWSSEHFGEVVEQFARLSEVDPGGRLSNRPAESLASIFRPWLPQTSVDAARRLAALDAMRVRHPTVAWELLLSMLPEPHAIGAYAYKPRFRDWQTDPEPITRGQVVEMYLAAAERVIEDAGRDAQRWVALIERFDDLPPPVLPKAVEALREVAIDESASELRKQAWKQLQGLVMRHRRFSHTDWALNPDQLDQLEELEQSLAPNDPVELVRWLFDEHVPDLPEEGKPDFEAGAYLEAIARRRVEAVQQVYGSAGLAGVLRLANTAQFPWFVGEAVGRAELGDVGAELFEHIDADDEVTPAARAWTAQRARTLGWTWVEAQVAGSEGRPIAQARVLLESADYERAWELARQTAAVDAAYWSEFAPFGRGPAFELAEQAATELLDHGRPRAALNLMSSYVESVPIDRALVMRALERLVDLAAGHPDETRVDSHEIERLLDHIRDGDLDEDRLMVLEWQLRPALGFGASSPVLERRLAREPEFFVEVMSLCFKPRHREMEKAVSPQVASNAYRLLDDWRVVPGSDGPAEPIDAEKLNRWVDEALDLLKEADREEIGLEIIGRVLATSTGDPDGTWPTRPVRDLIERVRRTELDTGFEIEVFNSRGFSSRGLAEEGDQERELMAQYKQLASKIADEWPRTAGILRSISSSFEAQAQHQDESAARFLEGFDR
jgi:hypothetical protein